MVPESPLAQPLFISTKNIFLKTSFVGEFKTTHSFVLWAKQLEPDVKTTKKKRIFSLTINK
jgi:hypothetical protein